MADRSTLPSFAQGLINGVTTLEMDCERGRSMPRAALIAGGLTRDGEVIVWHDENFVASKCRDTAPAFEGDEQWPYVGQDVANLTLAQLKTLDCGSLRQADFPLQGAWRGVLGICGVRISPLDQLTGRGIPRDKARDAAGDVRLCVLRDGRSGPLQHRVQD